MLPRTPSANPLSASSRCRGQWGDTAEFDDFAQDVLIEYTNVAACQGHRSIQTALVWQIAKRRMTDRQRRFAKTLATKSLPSDHLTADAPQSSLDTDQPRRRSTEAFNINQRDLELLRAKHLLGHSFPKIARGVGMKPEGVRSALRRARLRLAKQFALEPASSDHTPKAASS